MNDIKFVGLHAHSGVGSPFDGFGKPEEHMEFCYANGGTAIALTDHGNMNGLAGQLTLSPMLLNGEKFMNNTKQTKRKRDNLMTANQALRLKTKARLNLVVVATSIALATLFF
jgi:histidinol phosphatase-like PHP family hydrolase